jgi:hypothetical protein
MKRFLLSLYPAAWRKRYGDEFEALLEERPLTPFDVADVLLGAVDAHIHRRGRATSQHRKGPTMTPRLAGQAAVVGGLLILIGLLPLEKTSTFPAAFVMLAGAGALVVALPGLSGMQSRKHPLLVWATFMIPAAGIMMCWVGGVAQFLGAASGGSWSMLGLGLGTMIIGSALFAGITYRTRALPRPAAALLGLSTGLLLAPMIISGLFQDRLVSGAVLLVTFQVGTVGFPIGWIALGWAAIRLDRRTAVAGTPAAA